MRQNYPPTHRNRIDSLPMQLLHSQQRSSTELKTSTAYLEFNGKRNICIWNRFQSDMNIVCMLRKYPSHLATNKYVWGVFRCVWVFEVFALLISNKVQVFGMNIMNSYIVPIRWIWAYFNTIGAHPIQELRCHVDLSSFGKIPHYCLFKSITYTLHTLHTLLPQNEIVFFFWCINDGGLPKNGIDRSSL